MTRKEAIDKMICEQTARNIAEYRAKYDAAKNVRHLLAIKQGIGVLLRRDREDILKLLVKRGVIRGYVIHWDENVYLFPREAEQFGSDPQDIDFDRLNRPGWKA